MNLIQVGNLVESAAAKAGYPPVPRECIYQILMKLIGTEDPEDEVPRMFINAPRVYLAAVELEATFATKQ